jgi:hypothetical protein
VDERGIPQVGADQHAGPPLPREIQRVDACARREMLAVLEPAVRRQIDLAVHGDRRAVAHRDRRVVELCRGPFLDEAEHRAHRARRACELRDERIVAAQREAQRVGARPVPGQRQLGKHEHGGARGARIFDDIQMLALVGSHVARRRRDLRDGDG